MKNKQDYTYEETVNEPYAKVTMDGEDRKTFQPKNVWELKLYEFIDLIDPVDYFRSTGEAILKIRRLEADLFAAAGQARKIGNILDKLRDDNVYLETQWNDGRLLLKAKNPRKNRESKAKALKENENSLKIKAKNRYKK